MAKGKGGFDLKDAGNIASGPSARDLGVPKAPARTTMNNEAVRTSVTKNPQGERTA